MKKLICIFVALFMLAVSFGAAAESAESANSDREWTEGSAFSSEEFEVVAENDKFTLAVKASGNKSSFVVTNKESGKQWYSNPQLTKEERDSVKLGLGKLDSQICISYLTEERTDGTVTGNTAKASVKKIMANDICIGVVTTYNFDKEVLSFKVPVAYMLTENGFKAEILFDKIEENGTSTLNTVELLPMFGAAKTGDEGYLFIPDGSGALIDYKGQYDAFPDYQESIYGKDSSVDLDMRTNPVAKGIRMPVYGAKVGDDAYFAIITSNDGSAKLNATSSASTYNVSTVWPTFNYREFDEIGIMSKDSVKRAVRILDPYIASENPVVEFAFLSGDKANYSGMANYYRDYLVKNNNLEKKSESYVAPLIQAFGKTYSKETFFGVPVNKALVATSTEDVEAFYNTLKENGVSEAKFFLYGFNKSGYQNKYVKRFGVDSKVGGTKGLKNLVNTVGKDNVYMSFDVLHDYNFGGLFSDAKYAAALNKVTIIKQNGMVSTGAWKGTISWKLMSNSYLTKYGTKLIKSFKNDLGVGVTFENMGTELYNDFDEKYHADRNEYITTYQNLNKAACDKGLKVGSDGANIYMLGHSDIISDTPLTSSDKLLFTDHVPFYAMVVHGYANMASMPFNNATDIADYTALCAQLGIMPTFRVTSKDSNSLQDSNLNFLFNSEFDGIKDKIIESTKTINSVSDGLSDKLIVSHEYVDSLSIVEYENGVKLVYNRSKTETATYNGQEIAAGAVVRI